MLTTVPSADSPGARYSRMALSAAFSMNRIISGVASTGGRGRIFEPAGQMLGGDNHRETSLGSEWDRIHGRSSCKSTPIEATDNAVRRYCPRRKIAPVAAARYDKRTLHGRCIPTSENPIPSLEPHMYSYPADIYTEPEPDPDTLANLGPLTGMAGIWTSADGMDVNPKPDGPEHQPFIERYELQPIDAQTNGPQLFYGLRYHTRIVKPDDPETFHDQVGYWLWEPATRAILLTLSIPEGQTAMAVGQATPDAKSFTLEAVRGSLTNGIVSNPFLEQAFRTDRYTIKVDIHDGWHVVVRARHAADHPRPVRAVSPHRSQPAAQDRRAHTQSDGVGGATSKRRVARASSGCTAFTGHRSESDARAGAALRGGFAIGPRIAERNFGRDSRPAQLLAHLPPCGDPGRPPQPRAAPACPARAQSGTGKRQSWALRRETRRPPLVSDSHASLLHNQAGAAFRSIPPVSARERVEMAAQASSTMSRHSAVRASAMPNSVKSWPSRRLVLVSGKKFGPHHGNNIAKLQLLSRDTFAGGGASSACPASPRACAAGGQPAGGKATLP